MSSPSIWLLLVLVMNQYGTTEFTCTNAESDLGHKNLAYKLNKLEKLEFLTSRKDGVHRLFQVRSNVNGKASEEASST